LPTDAREHPAGGTGTYDVVFVLGVPGVGSVSNALDVSALLNSGDSLLEGNRQRVEFQAADRTSWSCCEMIPNQHGRLAQVRMTLDAGDFAGASATADDYVMPLLSRLAYGADVAIEVAATIITETSTFVTQVSATLIGSVQPVPDIDGWTTPEVRPFLSIYRDGLNANPPSPIRPCRSTRSSKRRLAFTPTEFAPRRRPVSRRPPIR